MYIYIGEDPKTGYTTIRHHKNRLALPMHQARLVLFVDGDVVDVVKNRDGFAAASRMRGHTPGQGFKNVDVGLFGGPCVSSKESDTVGPGVIISR